MEPILNRVAQSDIVVYNLEALWDERPIVELDLAPFLVEGLVLREKAFREQVQKHDWLQYADCHVALYCSTDAILPIWAYLLVATKLQGIARSVTVGRREDLLRDYFAQALAREDWSKYQDRIVVIKGCASKLVPTSAYVLAATYLQTVARKLMYGEPCSSVPLWRRPETRPEPQTRAVRPAFPESTD
jgi:hypothetical protein